MLSGGRPSNNRALRHWFENEYHLACRPGRYCARPEQRLATRLPALLGLSLQCRRNRLQYR